MRWGKAEKKPSTVSDEGPAEANCEGTLRLGPESSTLKRPPNPLNNDAQAHPVVTRDFVGDF